MQTKSIIIKPKHSLFSVNMNGFELLVRLRWCGRVGYSTLYADWWSLFSTKTFLFLFRFVFVFAFVCLFVFASFLFGICAINSNLYHIYITWIQPIALTIWHNFTFHICRNYSCCCCYFLCSFCYLQLCLINLYINASDSHEDYIWFRDNICGCRRRCRCVINDMCVC